MVKLFKPLAMLALGVLMTGCVTTTSSGNKIFTVTTPKTNIYGERTSNCNREIRVVNQTKTPKRVRVARGYLDSERVNENDSSPGKFVLGMTSALVPTGESEYPYTHQISSTQTTSIEAVGLFRGIPGKRGLEIVLPYCPPGDKTKLLIFEIRGDGIYKRDIR